MNIRANLLVAALSVCLTPLAIAETHAESTRYAALPSISTTTQYEQLPQKIQLALARNFNLTPAEYSSYLYDMHATADRYFYRFSGTSPLIILAAHASNNPVLFHRYVHLAVVEAHLETERLLKVNRAFFMEAHKLYPNEYPVMTAQMHAQALQSGDVVRLYCKTQSPTCDNILPIVLKQLHKTSGVKLDIFLVGTVNRGQIEQFAKRNNVPRNLVASGAVTLNFGESAFQSEEAGANAKLPLPYISVVRNGRQIPVNLARTS